MVRAMKRNGFIEGFDVDSIIDEEELEEELQNFSLDQDDQELSLTVDFQMRFTPDQLYNGELGFIVLSTSGYKMRTQYAEFVQNYVNAVYKPKPTGDGEQMSFKQFSESYAVGKTLAEYGLEISGWLSSEIAGYYNTGVMGSDLYVITVYLTIKYADVITPECYDLILFLDASKDVLVNAGKYMALYQIMEIRTPYTENLHRTFGKYFPTPETKI